MPRLSPIDLRLAAGRLDGGDGGQLGSGQGAKIESYYLVGKTGLRPFLQARFLCFCETLEKSRTLLLLFPFHHLPVGVVVGCLFYEADPLSPTSLGITKQSR